MHPLGTKVYHESTNMHPLGTKVYLLKRYRPSDSFRTFFSESAHCWKWPSVCPVLSQWTLILHRHQQTTYLQPVLVMCCPFSTNL